MKNTVIYHRADFDGIFCREIARKFLPPDTEFIGWDYGDPFPVVPPGDRLYILDLSVEPLMSHPNLIWIDHHKTAIQKFSPGTPGYRIDGVAACRLTWQWFTKFAELHHPSAGSFAVPLPTKEEFIERKVIEPLAVQLAGEYDIWDKRDPRAELFQHGLRSQELTDNVWDILLSGPTKPVECVGPGGQPVVQDGLAEILVQTLLEQGEILQYAKAKENESIIKKNGFTAKFEGLTFLACNASHYNSLLFTAGIKPEHEALLGFCWREGAWAVSLYGVPHRPDVDLTPIAVKYGGGGHRQACGFKVANLTFIN